MYNLEQNLSPHFQLKEFVYTGNEKFQQANIDYLTEDGISKLKILATTILEPIRQNWGSIRINSGVRCPTLNTAIGGVNTSQHVLFEAADITPLLYPTGDDLHKVFTWIVRDSGLKFGQCIFELESWIHISLGEPYRAKEKCQQALDYIEQDGKKIYLPAKF